MADGYAMSSRILRAIENILRNDPELREFTIVPAEDNLKNKSPVLYEEHAIGLESWCVKHVYQYACSILFEERKLLSQRKISYHKMEDLNHLLIGAILINPEVGTFWNMKRELVDKDALRIEEELQFSKIVLTHKSKCNEAFSYRRWLLQRILNKMTANNLQVPMSLLQNELAVINMAAERSPNNYHGWNHRIWCMQNITSNNPAISSIIYSELTYTQEWINHHVSEHAGYHYRQYLIKLVKEHKRVVTVFDSYYDFVIKKLLNLINDGEYSNLLVYLLGKPTRSRLLEESCSFINFICILLYDLFVLLDKVNQVFQEHESLYYHRRFLVYHLTKVPFEYHCLEFPKMGRISESVQSSEKNITECDTIVSVQNSDDSHAKPKLFKLGNKFNNYNLCEIVSNCEKNFLLQNSNLYASKYRKWLTHVIGFE